MSKRTGGSARDGVALLVDGRDLEFNYLIFLIIK